jgi:hypothetical protein
MAHELIQVITEHPAPLRQVLAGPPVPAAGARD